MCEQCLTDCITWPDLLPGWSLIRAQKDGRLMKAGDWGLVESNDPTVLFKTDPIADPLIGMSEQDIDRLTADSEQWQGFLRFNRAALDFVRTFVMAPMVGRRLVAAAETAGFVARADGDLTSWLFDRMGRRVAAEPGERGRGHDAAKAASKGEQARRKA